MTPKLAMHKLNAIEGSLPVSQWTVDGMTVWPLLRISIGESLIRSETSKSKFALGKTLRRLGRRLKALSQVVVRRGSAIFDASRPKDVEALFLIYSSDRVPLKGLWYERFSDPLARALVRQGRRSQALEYCNFPYEVRPSTRNTQWLTPIPELCGFMAVIAARLCGRAGRRDAQRILDDLRGFDPSLPLPSADTLLLRVKFIHLLSKWFMRHLRKTRPKVVFIVCYYNAVGMALVMACRRLGIVATDIQHGVAGEFHRAYGRWQGMPAPGFDQIPSVFWTWNARDAAAIDQWAAKIPAISAVIGGHPWIEMWNTAPETAAVNDAAVKMRGSADRVALVTLQPGVRISGPLLEAIAASPNSWQWWLRLHPAMRADGPELADAPLMSFGRKVEVKGPSELPLLSLLSVCDSHLTAWSSVVFEATSFGIHSILTDERAADFFASEIASGEAELALNSEEILAAVATHRRRAVADVQVSRIEAALQTIFKIGQTA